MISRDDMEIDEDEAVPQSPEQVMQDCHEYLDEVRTMSGARRM